jgi:hypothetical protein
VTSEQRFGPQELQNCGLFDGRVVLARHAQVWLGGLVWSLSNESRAGMLRPMPVVRAFKNFHLLADEIPAASAPTLRSSIAEIVCCRATSRRHFRAAPHRRGLESLKS